MKLIDLEAHFLTREFAECVLKAEPLGFDSRLFDMGEGRIKVMDESGIDMQVLSLFQPPHIQRLEPSAAKEWARRTNDELSIAVKKYPDKFIGLAAIPVQSPTDAVEELERAVTELKLKGVCIGSNAREEYFDNNKYWGIFEKAEKLDVPIYLHPTEPSSVIANAYAGYPDLSGPPHGFHTEVSLHVMRLMYSGLFDRYPKLKIILGHMGEGLPFCLPRIDAVRDRPDGSKQNINKKKPSEYLQRNFTVTTSGMFFLPALICSYLAIGADHIAFGVDYPVEKNNTAVEFIKAAPICESDKEKICHANAEALFKL